MVISDLKSFNVYREAYKTHAAKYDWYVGDSRKRKLESLKSERQQQTTMLKCNESKEVMLKCNESKEVTKTFYKVSHVLARNVKLYLNGKIMKQAGYCYIF